jgi:zinc D-Ala-D-Ala dipeptidase
MLKSYAMRFLIFILCLNSCSGNEIGITSSIAPIHTAINRSETDTIKLDPADEKAGFKDVQVLDKTIPLDIRYATTNNFTKAQIYDCAKCLLRPEAAKAIAKAHAALKKQGYGGLKMFDCYRPRPYQQRLWDKVPDPNYVTPPAKGSMHSRGAAVDLTIVDKSGKELDMGTAYDFFGPEAHYDYTKHTQTVLDNRKLLRTTLAKYGFEGIRTEWWHFSYRKKKYELSEYVWKCPTQK